MSANAETAGEKAYRRIRGDIIFGRLQPAQKLKLEGLKESYGVSVSTLRELLNRLTSEGLIVAESARGFEVASVSAQNFKEIANLRQLLECHALEQSFAFGGMEWEGRVVAAHHKLALMEKRMMSADRSAPETWKRYDWEFHHALISACGSKALLDTHAAVYDKYLRYQMIAVVFRGEVAALEHRQLLDQALNRDAAAAQIVLVKHIQDCVAYTLSKGAIGPNPSKKKITEFFGKLVARMMDQTLLGLIGRNIQSSLSPALHEDALRVAGLLGTYRLMDLDLSGRNLRDSVQASIDHGLSGFNVTFPCKEEIIPLLDELSPEALKIGAVNTVVIQDDGRLCGYNTDSIGFVRGFEEELGRSAATNKTATLVGAGGAGRAVAFALMTLDIARLFIYDKDRARTSQLLADIDKHYPHRAAALEQLDECISVVTGLVNATPVGMRGVPGQPVPPGLIGKQEWVADVIYTPIETELVNGAMAKGIKVMTGGRMCVHQAAEAFRLFTGCSPDIERMHQLFRVRVDAI